jgi:hypothetical protein
MDADTVDFSGRPALIRLGAYLDFCKAGVFAFRDEFVNFAGFYIHDWSKLYGYAFWLFYNSPLGKNGLDFITCGKNPVPTVKNHASPGLLGRPPALLP